MNKVKDAFTRLCDIGAQSVEPQQKKRKTNTVDTVHSCLDTLFDLIHLVPCLSYIRQLFSNDKYIIAEHIIHTNKLYSKIVCVQVNTNN